MSSRKIFHISAILILLLCMFVNCWHTHLWGPDEPREAEIAREIYQKNSWVVPLFSGIPFVEKPSLYYDSLALIYAFSPHPGSLRLFSALLGCLMLAALYCFAAKKCGHMIAVCSCSLCISMPQFYRAAHWILLDIGVGTWVTAGLVCYGLWSLSEKEKKEGLAIFFFSFAALAMLTKGIITVVYLGMIIVPHWFFFRRKKLPPAWTVLFFLIPIGIWIWLLYREGSFYFLHEHFINNTVGRLLHYELRLKDSPIIISDVGNSSPFFFYFKRMPNMFGAVVVFLPFSIIWAWRTLGWKSFRWNLPGKLQYFWDFLTKPYAENIQRDKALLGYLMLWSFVPVFIFSIPSIKEVTYLLPSYAGIAMLVICYVFDRLRWKEEDGISWGRNFILPLLCFVSATQILAGYSLILFFVCIGLIHVWLIWNLIHGILHRDFQQTVLPILATLIGCVLVGNTPELMVRSKLDRKCYCELSEAVWKHTGTCQLHLLTTEESIRGALPFYGKRDIHVLRGYKNFYDLFATAGDHAFLFYENQYKILLKKTKFMESLPKYQVIFPGFPKKADTFVLLVPKPCKKEKR